MSRKKMCFRIMCISSVLCWIGTIIPSVYVIYHAYESMDGTTHGFNGEMLYGINAFLDTVLMYIAFFFPFFLLWIICLIGVVISTVAMIIISKSSVLRV